jgi:hypothetical protein
VSLLANGVAKVAGGAGLGNARSDDTDVNVLIDNTRPAGALLVLDFCGRNIAVVVASYKLTHIKNSLSCCHRGLQGLSTRTIRD